MNTIPDLGQQHETYEDVKLVKWGTKLTPKEWPKEKNHIQNTKAVTNELLKSSENSLNPTRDYLNYNKYTEQKYMQKEDTSLRNIRIY